MQEKQFVFQKQFDKMRKGHEELEAKVQKLAKEILQNVTDLITQISDIKNNTQLKMDEEKEQVGFRGAFYRSKKTSMFICTEL